jgi:hypothetical protein
MGNLLFIFLPIFGSIVLVWVLSLLIVSEADSARQAVETADGRIEFAPDRRNYIAVYLLVAFLAYLGIIQLIRAFRDPMALIGVVLWPGLALILLAAFPGKILAGKDGLEQVYWLWKNKRIEWQDVAGVTVEEAKRIVTIRSKSGTTIAHRRQLADRARLMAEIEKYCPEKLPSLQAGRR